MIFALGANPSEITKASQKCEAFVFLSLLWFEKKGRRGSILEGSGQASGPKAPEPMPA
ncbi:hypothetical protein SAMN05421827_11033 [Pedobacter terrae]|uniref:Uncharacterized protein n=1 Tax=Pedobacter terrae TaxID=405671 RepID=A0A1G7WMY9_9SPHI|nr:hypothetical protein SAMN05421827_11033 [Pedobacter terrae]